MSLIPLPPEVFGMPPYGTRLGRGDTAAARALGAIGGSRSGPGRLERVPHQRRAEIAAAGGRARAAALSPERLREIALLGVAARHRKREGGS